MSTSNDIYIVVPTLPPSVNHLYCRARNGSVFLHPDVAVWRNEVWAALRAVGARRAPEGALEVTIALTPRNRRRRDIDNVLKAALDALASALDFDDARVARLIVERYPPAAQQRCEIRIRAID